MPRREDSGGTHPPTPGARALELRESDLLWGRPVHAPHLWSSVLVALANSSTLGTRHNRQTA